MTLCCLAHNKLHQINNTCLLLSRTRSLTLSLFSLFICIMFNTFWNKLCRLLQDLCVVKIKIKISAFKQIKWHKKHDCLHKRYEVCWYHINSMYNHQSEHIFIWCTFSSWLCLWYNDDFKIKHNFIHVTTHTTTTTKHSA